MPGEIVINESFLWNIVFKERVERTPVAKKEWEEILNFKDSFINSRQQIPINSTQPFVRDWEELEENDEKLQGK